MEDHSVRSLMAEFGIGREEADRRIGARHLIELTVEGDRSPLFILEPLPGGSWLRATRS